MPSLNEYAYLAGLIDDDGTVAWISDGKGKKKFFVRISTYTHEPTIDWLVKTFGGQKYVQKIYDPRGKLPQWRWEVKGMKALELYECIQPYMLLKNKNWGKSY